KNRAHVAQLAQLAHDRERKSLRFVPLHHVRSNLGLGKFAHGFAEVLLLGSVGELHRNTGDRSQETGSRSGCKPRILSPVFCLLSPKRFLPSPRPTASSVAGDSSPPPCGTRSTRGSRRRTGNSFPYRCGCSRENSAYGPAAVFSSVRSSRYR